ncbi:MAG: NUDIX hydrolase [Verrucomicrobiales bacterium]|nr:NUDIX hydrolase [Verrucomicrobiales bacterium]
MPDNYLDRLPERLRKVGAHEEGEIEILTPAPGEAGFGVLYEDKYILLLRDKVRFPEGSIGGYLRILNQSDLKGRSGSVIVPVVGDSMVFIRTFRHAIREWSWELPRGFHEEGLSEEQNARKELQEELGGEVIEIARIGEINANTGLLAGTIGVYRALIREGSLPGVPEDRHESIRGWELVDESRISRFLSEKKVVCGITLAALFLYLDLNEPEKRK